MTIPKTEYVELLDSKHLLNDLLPRVDTATNQLHGERQRAMQDRERLVAEIGNLRKEVNKVKYNCRWDIERMRVQFENQCREGIAELDSAHRKKLAGTMRQQDDYLGRTTQIQREFELARRAHLNEVA